MKVIFYENTKTPSFTRELVHKRYPLGMAYAKDDFFVHVYGDIKGLWTISPGLVVTEQAHGTLEDWIKKVFGAKNIITSNNLPGEVVSKVWRPGLYYQNELHQALEIDEYEHMSTKQALKILVSKLDELFLYLEPSEYGLVSYSHKTRELLISACTEIENIWHQYILITNTKPKKKKYTTNDYVKLCQPLFLNEYEIRIKPYKNVKPIRPFYGWNTDKQTQSLDWYNAYNKTKHDRVKYFSEATLSNCIYAVAGNIVLFCVRYGPHNLYRDGFEIVLVNPNPVSFYVPNMILSADRRKNLCWGIGNKVYDFIQPWIMNPLRLID
ncbi:hypothetical protein [Coxiella burnetii]|uniref:hypothetical protein n=1 Tax=Coxiella burnetii TaxID=777 RepID=UPI0022314E4E|nr:hypothetical protein [Coxiella burnetii]